MAQIFTEMMEDKDRIMDALLTVLQSVPKEVDYTKARLRIEEDMAVINAKKDRLLELSMADAVTVTEFKNRNEAFNQQLRGLEMQMATIQMEEQRQKESALNMDKIRQALEQELSFSDGINSKLVATILEKIVVKKAPRRRSTWTFF